MKDLRQELQDISLELNIIQAEYCSEDEEKIACSTDSLSLLILPVISATGGGFELDEDFFFFLRKDLNERDDI